MEKNNLPWKELGDWEPEQFEAYGQALLKRIREHFEHIRETPVTSHISPAELLALLDKPLPEKPQPFEHTLEETWNKVIPHLTHWNHPSFHAYFSISASFPGILADLLISSLNVNALVWKAAPAASALEKVVLRWMAEMVGYDPTAEGVLLNGASLATFYALAAARDVDPDLDVRTKGFTGRLLPKLRIYTSDQAHSSVDKAAIALGIGTENVVHIPTDEQYRMRADKLEEAIQLDIEKGYRPMAVVATVGTTATGAVDPISSISQICKQYGIWLHIDAAYGGFWNLVPEVQAHAESLQLGDSLVVNPHKCLYTPLEVTTLYCRRKGALANTFRLVPEYLQTVKEDGSVDYMDYSLQLGRSFRALKIWWVIESFGREGLAKRMGESIRLARWLEDQIAAHPDFLCPASSPFALVSIQYVPQSIQTMLKTASSKEREILQQYVDQCNAKLLEELNKTRTAYASHAVIREGYIIRISIGNIHTTEEDIQRLWNTLQVLAKKVSEQFPLPTLHAER
ncbi:pyridoxal phosphate-dependent decarboxylase family protein [Thermoflavimicrobium dichotomicum]|uniref:Aromatic-L-amino-acid decarboxylase n=1 Tax=Thermoflavimicrobium dichotomicum TaxID=46223 RepID=A0A1I3UVG9_9BACL|nr:aminotransferase class V-fold PLP-dependent enzyme [Thermoflavimicrobium dichotomicum]SFJ86689.1 aromatic-L-amino-acid decarboxylase [Thermoflavimicrobium dichotomicum]